MKRQYAVLDDDVRGLAPARRKDGTTTQFHVSRGWVVSGLMTHSSGPGVYPGSDVSVMP